MANTYYLLQSTTVGATTTPTIEFTAIPSTYTDLKLVLSARSNYATVVDAVNVTFNNSTSGYAGNFIQVSSDNSVVGATVGASAIQAFMIDVADCTANVFGTGEMYISGYALSTYKGISAEGGMENQANAPAYKRCLSGFWSNTAAITSIQLSLALGTSFVQYTTASLYGVKNA